MVWSYSGDPSTSTTDRIRFLIGDTDSCDQLVSNEEVDWAFSVEPQVETAAATLLEHLATKYARLSDMRVGDISKSLSQLSGQFEERAKKLRSLSTTCVLPFVGGLSKAGKQTLAENDDAVQPNFVIGQDDHPGLAGGADFFTLGPLT